MGLAKLHAIGERRRICVKEQTTLATPVKPTAAAPGAIRVLNASINQTVERIARKFTNLASRARKSRITGKKTTEWSIEKEIIPSGTAGTPPEDHDLWKNALGTYTNTPSTSDVYTPSTNQGSQKPLTITDHAHPALKTAIGAVIEELKISQSGPEPPVAVFSGWAKDCTTSGKATVSSVSSDDVTLTSGGAQPFEQYGVVAFYQSDGTTVRDSNSGNGFSIDSVNYSTDVVNVEANPSGVVLNDIVLPFTPAPSYVGEALGGIISTITITPSGESAITLDEVTKWEVDLKNNHEVHDKVAGAQTPVDFTEKVFEAKASLTINLREDHWQLFQRHQRTPEKAYALSIQVGSTAGSIFKIAMAQCELDGVPQEWPGEGVCTCTLNLYALASSYSTSDAITVTFQ